MEASQILSKVDLGLDPHMTSSTEITYKEKYIRSLQITWHWYVKIKCFTEENIKHVLLLCNQQYSCVHFNKVELS